MAKVGGFVSFHGTYRNFSRLFSISFDPLCKKSAKTSAAVVRKSYILTWAESALKESTEVFKRDYIIRLSLTVA